MDLSRLELFVNTVKYLKPIQIYFRIYYYLRNRILKNNKILKPLPDYNAIVWTSEFYNFKSYSAKEHCFTFLNISHSFKEKIDWNINQFGKLWTYNLNYFDYLNQKDISKDSGEYLIKDFLKNNINLKEGNEPYPISLRGINWVKFLSKNSIKNAEIELLKKNSTITAIRTGMFM